MHVWGQREEEMVVIIIDPECRINFASQTNSKRKMTYYSSSLDLFHILRLQVYNHKDILME